MKLFYENTNRVLDKNYKYDLINIMNRQIEIDGKTQYLSNAIPVFIKNVVDILENERDLTLLNYEL